MADRLRHRRVPTSMQNLSYAGSSTECGCDGDEVLDFVFSHQPSIVS
ncbi:MAG: hypothetical protein OXH00_17060 [Candidatus Poribacteria bacterium]|nr:hypothetical protein [Candidatus Poribacteria bacterium]